MVKIAIIVSRLEQLGPVRTVEILVERLRENNDIDLRVFFIDKKEEPDIRISVPAEQLDCRKFPFSDFNIIHTHGIRPDLFAFLHRRKIKMHISTLHNLIFEDLAYTYNKPVAYFFGLLWIIILRSADRLVCVSDTLADYYKRWFAEDKVIRIYNGIAEPHTDDLPDHDIADAVQRFRSQGLKIAGSACKLTKRKGIMQTLKWMEDSPGFGFICMGDGRELRKLRKYVEREGIGDRCYFSGFVPDARFSFRCFDIFVMPSYSEGFGLSLLEAVAARVPVVCSDIKVFRELFNSDEVTFFCNDDRKSLSGAINEALLTAGTKVVRAHDRFKKNYTSDTMALNHYNLYYLKT